MPYGDTNFMKWKSAHQAHVSVGMQKGDKAHGIIRQVASDGTWVSERTVHNGINSGLNRVVMAD